MHRCLICAVQLRLIYILQMVPWNWLQKWQCSAAWVLAWLSCAWHKQNLYICAEYKFYLCHPQDIQTKTHAALHCHCCRQFHGTIYQYKWPLIELHRLDTCAWKKLSEKEIGMREQIEPKYCVAQPKVANTAIVTISGTVHTNWRGRLIKIAYFVKKFAISKTADLNQLVQGGQLYRAFPFIKGSLVDVIINKISTV